MKRIYLFAMLIFLIGLSDLNAQNVTIQVKTKEGQVAISPYIYGRNNSFSDVFGTATSSTDILLYQEAGLRFSREGGGNNSTKYNWRKKLSSHPDWYNNVYAHDWDYSSTTIQTNMPSLQAMWTFQLIGKAAANTNNNFNDWSYNGSQWWSGCAQNLAGGGTVNTSGGSTALVDGNPGLYLMDWNADSTTAILDHFFGENGIGLNQSQFQYWNMDNEPEIWSGTHDDVMPTQMAADSFLTAYFEVAKKARAKFPDIKLAGPVPANEWQWFKWGSESLKIGTTYYCWLEYFIKKVAEEQKSSGIRLVDVIDIHFYPTETTDAQVLQLHRAFFDKTYVYPGANGVKTINGGWDTSQKKEYILQRVRDWLDKYMGTDNGVGVAVTESGFNTSSANVASVLYSSILGTFANNGVEIYTPWTWSVGMWESLHLFSRYAKTIRVSTTSSLDSLVSGYSSINANADSLTVILVNRDMSSSKTVTVNLADFTVSDGSFTTLTISSLPSGETFTSHTSNALKVSTVTVSSKSATLTLPSLSTTAVILRAEGTGSKDIGQRSTELFNLYPNPTKGETTLTLENPKPLVSSVCIFNQAGNLVYKTQWDSSIGNKTIVNTSAFSQGVYFVRVENEEFSQVKKLVVTK